MERNELGIISASNGLPSSPRNFTTSGSGLNFIASNNYFILDPNNPLPNIVTTGSVLILDAKQIASYPTTASTWYDLSGNLYNTALNNGPSFNPDGYFKFDGVDDNARPSTYRLSSTDPAQPYTIVATIKRDGSSNGGIVTQYLTSGDANRFGFRERLGYLSWWKDSDRATATAPTVGRWAQIAGTRDAGGDVVVYVNGEQKDTGTDSDTFANHPLTIGAFATTTAPFSGSIADVKIYEKSLTPTEILQNYYQAPIVTDGLVFAVDAGNLVSYESGSNTTYSLTGSLSGSLINGVGYSQNNGGNWVFDGVDDYTNFGDTTLTEFGTGDFTLSAWIFIPTNVIENVIFFKGIIIKKGASAANAGYGMYYNTGQQKFLWSTANGTTAVERFTVNTWGSLKGTWANIVMIRQSGATNNGNFYINGTFESIASSTTVVNVNNDFNLTIGASSTLASNYYFQGNISIAQIYNRALSAQEVSQNFQAQRSRFGL
jgi:hypothetical protein